MWAAIGAALPQTSRAAPPVAPTELHIVHAFYGGSLGQDDCDVTEQVTHSCDGRVSCRIRLDETLCPADGGTSATLIPRLEVTFRCGTTLKPHSRAAEPPGILRLSCFMAGLTPSPPPSTSNANMP